MARLIFIAIVLGVVYMVWRGRDSAHGRAGKRLLLIGFAVVVIFTILFPEVTTVVAGWVGIGRGTDLVVYLTAFSVMFLAASVYLKFKRMEDRIARLASEIALREWDRELGSSAPSPETSAQVRLGSTAEVEAAEP